MSERFTLFGCFCGKYGIKVDGELQPGPCLNREDADAEIERLRSEEKSNEENTKSATLKEPTSKSQTQRRTEEA